MRLLLVFLVGVAGLTHAQEAASKYTYVCREKKCLRTLKDSSNENSGTSLNVCKLNCDDLGPLWPKPTGGASVGKDIVALYPSNITLENLSANPEPIREMLQEAFNIFQGYLQKVNRGTTGTKKGALENTLQVHVTVSSGTTDLTLSVDESYSLEVTTTAADNKTVAKIQAGTFFGARHAIETLSQLIAYDDVNKVFQAVSSANITDKPVFPYRGIMLDTSRNYFTVDSIKKLIDGMSYNKLSVFHWHITDSHSFPMEVPKRPKMIQYGAYSPEKIYTVSQIKDVVKYARQRGVKVIPELDQPAHSGYGYQWGVEEDNMGDLVVCVESEPWYDFCVEPPCGQLNIVNDNVTLVVGEILTDMMDMFDKDIFHMGGDEVDFRCYNSSKQITDWMVANNFTLTTEDFYRLWAGFQEKLLQKLLTATGRNDTQVLMWTSGLTDPQRIENYLDKSRYIIQIWSDSSDANIGGLLQKGYKALFSNVDALYLDCGFPAWLGDGHNWCAPIKGWQTVYDNDPEKIYAKFTNETIADGAVKSGQIIGSETPLWAEQVDDHALESRIWPRAAAHAERVWSHPKTSYAEAEIRMVANRDRIVARGIGADRLQPEFCLQHEGKCYDVAPTNPGPDPSSANPPGPDPSSTNPGNGGGGGGSDPPGGTSSTTLPTVILVVITMILANLA